MKNFLAIDTGGSYLCVVAAKNGEFFTAFEDDCAMRHSVLLMTKVDEALAAADMRLEECDFFAACVGAGSFTGIRIGISAAKGFALACRKPTLPVTSFDIAAYNAVDGDADGTGRVLCLVDALHGFYYACGYENGRVVLPPAYLSEEEVRSLAAQGYALRSCGVLPISERVPVRVVSPAEGLKRAASALAEKGAFGDLTALYVRKSSAELGKAAKEA